MLTNVLGGREEKKDIIFTQRLVAQRDALRRFILECGIPEPRWRLFLIDGHFI